MNNFEKNYELALNNAKRLSDKILIDGKLISAQTDKKIQVLNPVLERILVQHHNAIRMMLILQSNLLLKHFKNGKKYQHVKGERWLLQAQRD